MTRAVVDVRSIALNFGEANSIDDVRKPGEVLGWEVAQPFGPDLDYAFELVVAGEMDLPEEGG